MDWAVTAISELWRHAWAVVPVALGAVLLTRWLPLRPVTRHGVWVVVLLWFIAPLLLPKPPEDSLARVSALAEQAADQLAEATKPAPQDHLVTVAPRTLPPVPSRLAADTKRFPSVEVPATSTAPKVRSTRWTPPSLPLASRSSEPRISPAREAVLDTCPLPLLAPEGDVLLTALEQAESGQSPQQAVAHGEEEERVSALALWLGAFHSVRQTLSQLPAMPAWLWIGGAVLIASWHGLGLVWFAMRMRGSEAAPRWVVREVRRVAQRCGLQRVPEVRMIDACISPLVLTGLRPRLYLPVHLWDQLDRVGRRAILCHELAHLRRGDDWVRWGELVISTICWWHPLVWWVRGRIHEEADLSCDTWVTWLMPEGRRAYAEALLRTKAFVSTGGGSMPAVGLGATSVGARKFARRLTMVMTKSNRPGNSWSGGVLLAGLMAIGWAGLPAFSCPPDAKKAPVAPTQPARLLVAESPKMPAPPTPTRPGLFGRTERPAAPVAPTAPARLAFPRPVPAVSPAPAAVPGLLLTSAGDDNADRVRHLERQLREMQNELRALARGMQNNQAEPRVAPTARGFFGAEPHDSDEIIVRRYALSNGRLRALTELMIREDVPVLVRPMDDAIEVHATARHHRIFKAFVEMIEGRESAKADPFAATAPVQAQARERLERALAARNEAELRRRFATARNHELHNAQAQLHGQMQAINGQARELFHQAEALAHEADKLRDKADSQDDDANARKQLNRAARDVERKARELERKAEQLERKAEQLERKAEQMEEKAEHEHEHDDRHGHDHDHGHHDHDEAAWLHELGHVNVEPLVAIALEQAADGIRADAIPEVEIALREALAEVQVEAPQVADALAPILADESAIVAILEGVADGLEDGADSIHIDTGDLMEQILEDLEDAVAEISSDE